MIRRRFDDAPGLSLRVEVEGDGVRRWGPVALVAAVAAGSLWAALCDRIADEGMAIPNRVTVSDADDAQDDVGRRRHVSGYLPRFGKSNGLATLVVCRLKGGDIVDR